MVLAALHLLFHLWLDFIEAPQPLNAQVLERIAEYPTDGTHPYGWHNAANGTTTDLTYAGTTVARAGPKKRTYCCGVTFEVALGALLDANNGPLKDVDAKTIRNVRRGFCGAHPRWGERQVAAVLPEYGLGIEVGVEDAQPGDFVQLWRRDGTGHSAVFLGWVTDTADTRVAIHYWSTQRVTDGIGYRTERLRGIDRLYMARLQLPASADASS